jgi:hypothetical protein
MTDQKQEEQIAPVLSPMQVVPNQLGGWYLFFVEENKIWCSRHDSRHFRVSFRPERLMPVYKGAFRGFTALIDPSGLIQCIIQTATGEFITRNSWDSGLTWTDKEH